MISRIQSEYSHRGTIRRGSIILTATLRVEINLLSQQKYDENKTNRIRKTNKIKKNSIYISFN